MDLDRLVLRNLLLAPAPLAVGLDLTVNLLLLVSAPLQERPLPPQRLVVGLERLAPQEPQALLHLARQPPLLEVLRSVPQLELARKRRCLAS